MPVFPLWTIAAPIVARLLFAGTKLGLGGAFLLLVAAGLIGGVLAAVHQAEVVAHRVGEPFGTLPLAVAVTVIEVALIVSLMLACLGVVVLLAKALAPSIEAGVAAIGAPNALVGVIIAGVVLFPEGLAAMRAARANRLQTSLSLAPGSTLASTGLTIPAVAIGSPATGLTLTLGIDIKSTVLLLLSLFVTSISLGTGRTTVLQGTVLLVIFATYLFTTIVP